LHNPPLFIISFGEEELFLLIHKKLTIFNSMKQAAFIAVFVTATLFCVAQPANNVNNVSEKTYTSPDLKEMLSEIMSVVGLQCNIELKEADVMNIEADISHHKRYILYNPKYLDWIANITRDKWAVMALIAHEVGHHLNGHTISKAGSKPAVELEADEFAGFVLSKLGASLDEAQEVMKYIATNQATDTHPARPSRMLAIQTGWNKAADNSHLAKADKPEITIGANKGSAN
jgi:hypothetical protein